MGNLICRLDLFESIRFQHNLMMIERHLSHSRRNRYGITRLVTWIVTFDGADATLTRQ